MIEMREAVERSINALIHEGSRIDNINVERKWKEMINPKEPWIAQREYAGYATIVIEFVPKEGK